MIGAPNCWHAYHTICNVGYLLQYSSLLKDQNNPVCGIQINEGIMSYLCLYTQFVCLCWTVNFIKEIRLDCLSYLWYIIASSCVLWGTASAPFRQFPTGWKYFFYCRHCNATCMGFRWACTYIWGNHITGDFRRTGMSV